MKDDVIYRQAAIDKFEPWLKVKGYNEGELNMLKAVLYELKCLPSAQTERKTGGWILCSEQLPERHQKVLITIYGTDVIRMKQGESFQDALARTRKNVRASVGYRGYERWYRADGYPMIIEPIAWMSLPEPFVEDKNE